MALDFSHVVIGGGAIGLAIAARLAPPTASSTSRNILLLDRNRHVGQETSSRNSEVIHAGIYYPKESLKTDLCIKGKKMLYRLFDHEGIGYKRLGKWIVAQNEKEAEYLQKLHQKAVDLDVPTHFITREKANSLEPSIKVSECALVSPTTGIMDSHGLMTYLRGSFESNGGTTSLATVVQSIEPINGSPSQGYKLTTRNTQTDESFTTTTASIINSAGLESVNIANMLLPESHRLKAYFAKGQYYSYIPHANQPRPSHLIYPTPNPDLAGLGTHLTLDLAGQLRFGPDVEWITDPTDYSTKTGSERLPATATEIQKFYPSLDPARLEVSYCGIRPKLTKQGENAGDFYIKEESDKGLPGLVNLVGMESPGLTSCLAIAEYVDGLLK